MFLNHFKYEEAANEFSKALRSSPNNVRALGGLQEAAEAHLDNRLRVFHSQARGRNYKGADQKMQSLIQFVSKFEQYNIEIGIPRRYIEEHKDVRLIIAEDYYRKGERDISTNNYRSALVNFKKADEYHPNFRDVRANINYAESGARLADAERHYQNGLRNYQNQNYRRAYSDFQNAINQVRGYKDAVELQRSALEKGRVRLGIFEFGNDTRAIGAQGTLYSYVLNNIVNTRNPFVQVLDRQNLSRLLSEISFSQSGIIDASSAARAGKLLGLNYVVVGRLTNVIQEGGRVRQEPLSAFELYYANVDGGQQARCRLVTFMFYEGSTSVVYEAHYQIVHVETGRVVKSNIISARDSDSITYATYSGNFRSLYATNVCDLLFNSDRSIVGYLGAYVAMNSQINPELFTGRTNLKSLDQLQTTILRDIGLKMSNEIINELNR